MYLYEKIDIQFSEETDEECNDENESALEQILDILCPYSELDMQAELHYINDSELSILLAIHNGDENQINGILDLIGAVLFPDEKDRHQIALDRISEDDFAAEALSMFFLADIFKKNNIYDQLCKLKKGFEELPDTIKSAIETMEETYGFGPEMLETGEIEKMGKGKEVICKEEVPKEWYEDAFKSNAAEDKENAADSNCKEENISDVAKALDKIEKLVGIKEFKKYIKELELMRPRLSKWNYKENYPVQHMLFAIDSGNGCSTILDCFRDYIYSADLYYENSSNYYSRFDMAEVYFKYSTELTTDMNTVLSDIKDEIGGNASGIIGIHIEDWVDKLHSTHFEELLKYCAKRRHKNTFVFIVPYLDECELKRIHRRLNDLLNVHLIRFKPYKDKDLIMVARNDLAVFGLGWDASVDKCFSHALNMEKSDQRFFGIKTVKKLVTEILLLKAKNISLKRNNCSENMLMEEDFKDFMEKDEFGCNISGYDQLEAMIGLEEVKQRVKEIVLSVKAQKHMNENGIISDKPCYHMMFTGNPGTGKTAVARMVGRIFRENGLLPIGDLLEISRSNLVGEYIGQTGPKTVAVCRSALGSVMFFDEAYLLAAVAGGSDNRDYGVEALGALIAEMENNRDKFIVIMAGYKDDMDRLCELNAGLRERIPHRIHFENYSREELYRIFQFHLKGKYEVDDMLFQIAEEYFKNLPEEVIFAADFSNARFVRNIVERVKMKAMIRLYGTSLRETGSVRFLAIDFESAVLDKDICNLNEKKKRNHIGFTYIDCEKELEKK